MAPETKTSTVFTLVKHEMAVMRQAEAITTTAKRSITLASVLRTMIGTRRRMTTAEAMKERVSLYVTELEIIEILGSREILD